MKIVKIKITKKTPDLREGRSKEFKKGVEFECTEDLANKYIKKGVAELATLDIKPRRKVTAGNADAVAQQMHNEEIES